MSDMKKTARITGLWYLGLAVTGVLGFLVVRPAIHVPGAPTATVANLVERESLARLGLVLELGIAATQALAAVWFYKLFRSLNTSAAGTLAAYGLVNTVVILASAAAMATAQAVAGDSGLAPGGDVAATVQLLYEISAKLWSAGAVFFGLWLIPMGWVVFTSGCMPRGLGVTLLVGGGCYILSAAVSHGIAGAPTWLVEGLTLPASVGEFWMIGYLLTFGIRPLAETSADT